jgi:hypothetical protein
MSEWMNELVNELLYVEIITKIRINGMENDGIW